MSKTKRIIAAIAAVLAIAAAAGAVEASGGGPAHASATHYWGKPG